MAFLIRAMEGAPLSGFALNYLGRLIACVLGYAFLAIAANLMIWWASQRAQEPVRYRWQQIMTTLAQYHIAEILRLVYYVGLPYVALYLGFVNLRDMGLARSDWIAGIGWAVVVGILGYMLLALMARLLRRLSENGRRRFTRLAVLDQPWGWAFLLRESIYLEVSWAFCRSPFVFAFGDYYGAYAGFVFVLLVALVDPGLRTLLRAVGCREEYLLLGSLGFLTATAYALTHNLWLCLALHFAIEVTLWWMVRPLHVARSQ
ncbi:MAG: hypothetical protein H5T64_02185 [Chloroflexi bacterium]|nr:hypothetical protein [Chloroflexota bacterium]